jgi:hypothetical protein
LAKCPCAVNKLKTFAWCRKGRKREIEIKKKSLREKWNLRYRRGKKEEEKSRRDRRKSHFKIKNEKKKKGAICIGLVSPWPIKACSEWQGHAN